MVSLLLGTVYRTGSQELFITERTVKTHVAKIFRKLGFTSRLDAALYYKQLEGKNTTFQD